MGAGGGPYELTCAEGAEAVVASGSAAGAAGAGASAGAPHAAQKRREPMSSAPHFEQFAMCRILA